MESVSTPRLSEDEEEESLRAQLEALPRLDYSGQDLKELSLPSEPLAGAFGRQDSAPSTAEENVARKYKDALAVDLSGNRLRDLPENFSALFASLIAIDLSGNKFRDPDLIIKRLQHVHSLRSLRIGGCDMSEDGIHHGSMMTSKRVKASSWVSMLGRRLVGVTLIDDVRNPYTLSPQQREQADWMFTNFSVSCNSLTQGVDLRKYTLGEGDMALLMEALVVLPVEQLWLANEGDPSTTDSYRRLLVVALPKLTKLDGRQISPDERANAYRAVSREEKQIQRISRAVEGFVSPKTATDREESKTDPLSAELSGHPGADGVGKPNDAFHISAVKLLKARRAVEIIRSAWRDSHAGGSYWTKVELLMDYLQYLIIITQFEVTWPETIDGYVNGSGSGTFTYTIVGFDLDEVQEYWSTIDLPDWTKHAYFFILMAMPLFLYFIFKHPLGITVFENLAVQNWGGTWKVLLFGSAMTAVAAGVVAGLAPIDEWIRWAIVVVGFTLMILSLGFLMILLSFRFNTTNESTKLVWWSSYQGAHKKTVLLLITQLYMPIVRIILRNWEPVFRESPGSCARVMKRFPDIDWPSGDGCSGWSFNQHWPQLVSAIFFVVYVIGIPVCYALGIRSAMADTLSNSSVLQRQLEELARTKKGLRLATDAEERTQAKARIKEQQAEVNRSYMAATLEYTTPFINLYYNYNYGGRYYKLVPLTVKFSLLICLIILTEAVFFPSDVADRAPEVQVGTALGVIGLFLLHVVYVRPFQVLSENIVQIMVAAALLVNLVIMMVLVTVPKEDVNQAATDFFLLAVNIAVIIWCFATMIFDITIGAIWNAWISYKAKKKSSSAAVSELQAVYRQKSTALLLDKPEHDTVDALPNQIAVPPLEVTEEGTERPAEP